MKERSDNTFNAKEGIVIFPDNIKCFSQERNDYTELAMTAIKQKANVIKYISPSYKDYSILCDEAINQDCETFLLINDSVSNYKQLGIKAIMKYPFLVSNLVKENKYYYFFWKLAVSICYRVLKCIDEEKKELFPLIKKAIQQEPLVIFHVDSRISIYSKLCNMAYCKDKESINYMDINYVDKYLFFEIIRKEPDKIRYLDRSNDYYEEAWGMSLKIDGTLIKYLDFNLINEKPEVYFKLLSIASECNPEVIDYPCVINGFRLYNRRLKESIENSKKYCDNCDELLIDLDLEYETLTKKLIESEKQENNKLNQSTGEINIPNLDCPIKVKIRK